MPTVPLGRSAYKRSTGFVPEVRMFNMYLEKDESGISPDGFLRLQRPGTETLYTNSTTIRALTINPADGSIYSVGGMNLFVNSVDKGAVSDTTSGYSRIVITQLVTAVLNSTTILADSIALYDGATITTATVPDAQSVVDIDQLNGYILALIGTGRFYWLAPGESAFDPLNFATAESSNDNALAIRQVGEEFVIFGSKSAEPWQPTGNFDLPFERAAGRTIPHGCLAAMTVQRFDNTLVWVADDCTVRRFGPSAPIISTPAISERIRKRSFEQEMSAWTFAIDGHEFYVLRIPGEGTFVHDAATGEWADWATEGVDQWRPAVGDSYGGQTFGGGLAAGTIWRIMAARYGDDGEPFTRLVTGSVPVLGAPPRNDSLSVGVGASDDTIVRIRFRDGQDDYPEDYYDELDVRAPSDVCSLYRLGAPQPPYREVEISFAELVGVSVRGCMANEAWQ